MSFKYKLSESQALYNARIKHYKGKRKLVCFDRPVFNPYCELLNRKERVLYKKSTDNEVRLDNVKRTRESIYDIAMANDFEYFVTLTINSKDLDRYDRQEICKKLKIWLMNKVKRNGMKYIIIPEEHKDGAIHFHGLMLGDLKMVDSGHKTKKGQTIYNVGAWNYGFSTAVKLEGPYERITNYVVKYITKDSKRIFGKSYFAGGKGLIRNVPTRYENIPFNEIDAQVYHVPQAKLSVKYLDY